LPSWFASLAVQELVVSLVYRGGGGRGSSTIDYLYEGHFCESDFFIVPAEGVGWGWMTKRRRQNPKHWRYDSVKSIKGFPQREGYYGLKLRAGGAESHWWGFLTGLRAIYYLQEAEYVRLKEFLTSILTLNGKIQML